MDRCHHLSAEEREGAMCLRAKGRDVREVTRRLGGDVSSEPAGSGCAALSASTIRRTRRRSGDLNTPALRLGA